MDRPEERLVGNSARFKFTPKLGDFWNYLYRKSHVKIIHKDEKFSARKKRLEESVNCGSFSPNIVGFLSSQKSNGVARFIPVLDVETTLVYFNCIAQIDERLADCAVPGTFGGWSLGGKRRRIEEGQFRRLIQESEVAILDSSVALTSPDFSIPVASAHTRLPKNDEIESHESSTPISPYNKPAWVNNWQEYWKLCALLELRTSEKDLFLSFDIANFYDTIDHVRLRRKIQDKCPEQMHTLDILDFCLAQWNKSLRFYQPSSKGLPMDPVGDMSRVLANFFLVEFDTMIQEEVTRSGGEYLRWADDMTIICPNRSEAHRLLYFAGEMLHALGLNINASKVKLRSKSEFVFSWGFDVMDSLQNEDQISKGLALLMSRWDEPNYDRKETALRRCLTLLGKRPDLKSDRLWALERTLQTPGFLCSLSPGQMKSLINCSEQREALAQEIADEVMGGLFTEPKAALLKCLHSMQGKDDAIQSLFVTVREKLRESENTVLRVTAENTK